MRLIYPTVGAMMAPTNNMVWRPTVIEYKRAKPEWWESGLGATLDQCWDAGREVQVLGWDARGRALIADMDRNSVSVASFDCNNSLGRWETRYDCYRDHPEHYHAVFCYR